MKINASPTVQRVSGKTATMIWTTYALLVTKNVQNAQAQPISNANYVQMSQINLEFKPYITKICIRQPVKQPAQMASS